MKIWHPFTQEKTARHPIKITKGEGAYLFDISGKKYLDMVSSWWVNILGHSNEEISEAICKQSKILEHVIFAGFTHDPAEELCDKLSKFLPKDLECFFFSDNGSTSVEVSLKMAYQYFVNLGIKNRNIYINLDGGYHGDTFGAMSVSGINSRYHSTFSEFFFKTFSIDFPKNEEDEIEALGKLREFLKIEGDKVCALIVEPIIQGAAGMRIYRPEFLDKIVSEVRKYEIFVIFDEVMTGFYRTGKMFAMEYCSSIPDIVCLSKGITGGFLPLSLTITNRKIYEAFYSDDWKKAFIHGHSYTANPIACSAACKTIEILQRGDIQKNIDLISIVHKTQLKRLDGAYNKSNIGTISVFEVESIEKAKKIEKVLLNNGVIVRPIGKRIYLMPPYIISQKDLEYVYDLLCNI